MSNILLCGVGGQGTVLASRLIAFAAMEKGESVRTSETIGMSQRGGCVVSHVRTGRSIASPMIPKGSADIIIAFEPGEAVRNIDYLKPDGTVIVNKKAVKPVTASLTGSDYDGSAAFGYFEQTGRRMSIVDGDYICEQCGSPKVLNIALLASAAATGELGLTVDELKDAIVRFMPGKFHAMNLKAVELVSGT
ncbi:MAG: indolepyruvate oxidoreductase subunit beta [Ruminococcus sp.]|nr:indolepyruvate oxidoreductase subunit beta [Ruminococcus sp.]